MGTPSTVPPKFTPPVSDKLTPAQMAIHLRQLYLITGQHDQAIELVHSLIPAATTSAAASSATTVVAGVTSFNSEAGVITFFPNLGQLNNQTGVVAYTIQSNDDGRAILLSNAAPIAVTLDSTIAIPWYAVIFNQGGGTATLTPTTGLVNGGASLAVPGGGFSIVYFDGTNWSASAPSGAITVPQFADSETPSGTINGINVTFTLAHSPNPAASLNLFLNGLWQAGSGNDYTLTGNSIAMTAAPSLGSTMYASYRY